MAHANDRNSGIVTFTELYQRIVTERPFVSSILTGHLAIEFMLRRLVRQYDSALADSDSVRTHHNLVLESFAIGLISEAQREVLISINRQRNKLAHEITYEPNVIEMRQLWRQAASAFTDMTDGISQGIEALDEAATLGEIEEWILSELFIQICYDLHNQYVDSGGDIETF